MNKKQMASQLAKQTGLSQAKATEVVNVIFDAENRRGIIAIALDAGGKVTIPGFGTFGTKKRKARTGTNPANGKKISIPAKAYAYFKPGKTLRERVAR
jgi:nucleoid DNA-binding protein